MERTERESARKRRDVEDLLVLELDQQRACRMAQVSAEKLEHTGPAEKKGVPSVPQREREPLASTPESFLPKRKGTEPSVQSTKSQGGHSVSEK